MEFFSADKAVYRSISVLPAGLRPPSLRSSSSSSSPPSLKALQLSKPAAVLTTATTSKPAVKAVLPVAGRGCCPLPAGGFPLERSRFTTASRRSCEEVSSCLSDELQCHGVRMTALGDYAGSWQCELDTAGGLLTFVARAWLQRDGLHLLEFQRRSGCSVRWNKLFHSLRQRLQSTFAGAATLPEVDAQLALPAAPALPKQAARAVQVRAVVEQVEHPFCDTQQECLAAMASMAAEGGAQALLKAGALSAMLPLLSTAAAGDNDAQAAACLSAALGACEALLTGLPLCARQRHAAHLARAVRPLLSAAGDVRLSSKLRCAAGRALAALASAGLLRSRSEARSLRMLCSDSDGDVAACVARVYAATRRVRFLDA